jgi:hypothetical protein
MDEDLSDAVASHPQHGPGIEVTAEFQRVTSGSGRPERAALETANPVVNSAAGRPSCIPRVRSVRPVNFLILLLTRPGQSAAG